MNQNIDDWKQAELARAVARRVDIALSQLRSVPDNVPGRWDACTSILTEQIVGAFRDGAKCMLDEAKENKGGK